MTGNFDAFNEFERSMWEQRATGYADSFEALTGLTIFYKVALKAGHLPAEGWLKPVTK